MDVEEVNARTRLQCSRAYAEAVARAGGMPVCLPPIVDLIPDHLRLCRALVFTGGDDPRMEEFGTPTHPKATPLHPERQAYETALLRALADRSPDTPVLGVCLGMQLMALTAGGTLDQHLPETLSSAAMHWDQSHAIAPAGEDAPPRLRLSRGAVHSRHKQGVTSPGRMIVIANAPDGLIEAIADPARPFYLGVQWHPERTPEPELGQGLFDRLVAAVAKV